MCAAAISLLQQSRTSRVRGLLVLSPVAAPWGGEAPQLDASVGLSRRVWRNCIVTNTESPPPLLLASKLAFLRLLGGGFSRLSRFNLAVADFVAPERSRGAYRKHR